MSRKRQETSNAFLQRKNVQARVFEKALRRQSLPSTIATTVRCTK